MIPQGTIDAIKARLAADPPGLLSDLGMKGTREGSGWKAACAIHGERTPSLRVDVRGGKLAWYCHGACQRGGDAIELVGAVRGLSFLDAVKEAARIAVVPLDEEPREARRETPRRAQEQAPEPPKRPPQEEVQALLDACVPCARDAEVARWLQDARGLDPHAVDRYGLAFALPRIARGLPSWAERWPETGYRWISRVYDAYGRVACVRARLVREPRTFIVDGEENEEPKAKGPKGYSPAGLVLACPLAAFMLCTGAWPSWATRRLIISEGEPDFATIGSEGDGPRTVAVLGIVGGGIGDGPSTRDATREILLRIPFGSDVTIDTHNDPIKPPADSSKRWIVPSGDKYAEVIKSVLRGRCIIRDTHSEERKARAAQIQEHNGKLR